MVCFVKKYAVRFTSYGVRNKVRTIKIFVRNDLFGTRTKSIFTSVTVLHDYGRPKRFQICNTTK